MKVAVPCVFMFGLRSPLLWRRLRSSASSILSRLSARTLSGSWSQRTSYWRVHTDGGFEETIEAAKAAWTRIKEKHGTDVRRLALHGPPHHYRSLPLTATLCVTT